MKNNKYDFSGWATRNNIKCSDGRIIRRDAFKDNDGKKVPLVWNHSHDNPSNVLGHAILENREEGVYAYGTFNDTPDGIKAKKLVQHGDIVSLSIWANKLQQNGSDVLHGIIREVSLVLAGANPGAYIDSIIAHSDGTVDYYEDEAVIRFTEENETLVHAESEENEPEESDETVEVEKIFNTLTDEQKEAVYYLVGKACEDSKSENEKNEEVKHNDEEAKEEKENASEENETKELNVKEDDEDTQGGNEEMKHNVFDKEESQDKKVLSHSDIETIIKDAKRLGSMKESFLAHADANNYGIENVDYLFPDARTLNTTPEFIKRDTTWVQKFMNGTKHSPFSRVKTVFADITEDDARAKGYLKGKFKKEEVFALLKRTTTPTTVYKKQKMDRDDVVDITDFDVIAWLKGEMRIMLDEEIARAALVGDGRPSSSDDKISELNIRPIYNDEDLFTIKKTVDVARGADADTKAKAFIRAAIKARKEYKGSGNPTLYTTEDMLTDMLLLTDEMGRDLYESEAKLCTKLRVKEIVTVEVMEGMNGKDGKPLMGIIVNPNDYNFGADKGGNVNMFDDFDIDYNQQKYLIETRCSGALVKPFSAIAITLNEALS